MPEWTSDSIQYIKPELSYNKRFSMAAYGAHGVHETIITTQHCIHSTKYHVFLPIVLPWAATTFPCCRCVPGLVNLLEIWVVDRKGRHNSLSKKNEVNAIERAY
jgi:hypothetical protein